MYTVTYAALRGDEIRVCTAHNITQNELRTFENDREDYDCPVVRIVQVLDSNNCIVNLEGVVQ